MLGTGFATPQIASRALGIVRAGQPPCRRPASFDGGAAPGLVADRIVRSGRGVELPEFLSGLRIVRRDVAARLRRARSSRQHLVAGHDKTACQRTAVDRRSFPADRAGPGVQRDDAPVGRGVVHHVVVECEALRVARPAPTKLPQQLTARRIECPEDAASRAGVARGHGEHDAVMHERNALDDTGHHRFGPGELQLVDVLARDLAQRAEALRVGGPAEHEPIVRAWAQQHFLGDWPIGARLLLGQRRRADRDSRGDRNHKRRPDHEVSFHSESAVYTRLSFRRFAAKCFRFISCPHRTASPSTTRSMRLVYRATASGPFGVPSRSRFFGNSGRDGMKR